MTTKPKVPEGRSDVFLVDADWYAFCQGKDWEEMYDPYKVLSKAPGVKEPQEAQKAKAMWAMKAAKD